MLCVIFWVVLRRMNVISRRFGTLYPFHLHRRVSLTHSPMKMERIQSSETSANNVHTPENNPKDNAQHSDPGESLKFRITQTRSASVIQRPPLQYINSNTWTVLPN